MLSCPLPPPELNSRAHEPFPALATDQPCVRHLLNPLRFGQDFLGSSPLHSESLLGQTNLLPITSRPWSSGISPPSPLQPTSHLYIGVQHRSWEFQNLVASAGLNVGGHERPPLGPVGTSEDGNRNDLLRGRHRCFCNTNKSVFCTVIVSPYWHPMHNAVGCSAMVQV